MLPRLSTDTGGEFFGIRDSSAMLSEFVTLAASLGRYWRRSEAGEFEVAAPEVVIQVVAAESPPSLLRMVNDRWIPVDAVYEVVRAELGLRIERSRLQPGRYPVSGPTLRLGGLGPLATAGCRIQSPDGDKPASRTGHRGGAPGAFARRSGTAPRDVRLSRGGPFQ